MYTALHRHTIFVAFLFTVFLHPASGASTKKSKKHSSHKIQAKKEKTKIEKNIVPAAPLQLPLKERIKHTLRHENIFIAGGMISITLAIILFSPRNQKSPSDQKSKTDTFEAKAACSLCFDSPEELERHNKKLLSLPCNERHEFCNECLQGLRLAKNSCLCPICRAVIHDDFFKAQNLTRSKRDVDEDTKHGNDQATEDLVHNLTHNNPWHEGLNYG